MDEHELLQQVADHLREVGRASIVVLRHPAAEAEVVSPAGSDLPSELAEALDTASDVDGFQGRTWVLEGEQQGAVAVGGAQDLDAAAVAAVLELGARALASAGEAEVAWERVDELRRMNAVFLSADERLRKELSLHLHGKVQTSLLAASFILDRTASLIESDPDQAAELLVEIREELDRVREDEIREVSHLLHPSVIDVALTPAIRSLAGRYKDRFEVTVEASPAFTELDRPGSNALHPPLRLTIYRLTEEALANAARHGRPSHATVKLDVDDGDVLVSVRDDGRGFDPEAVSSGLGLGGVAYRVEDASGTWDIDSTPGEGTEISARLPVERRARPRASGSTAHASPRNPVPPRPR